MGLDNQAEGGEGDIFEDEHLTRQLKEKLTVNRPFHERAIDWARGLSFHSIKENKYITGITLAVAALIIAFPYAHRSNLRSLAESADAKTHLVAPVIDSSSIDSYMDDVQEAASMEGAPPTAIEALLYACQNCPEYTDFAKATGRSGIIPLDPAAAGVRPEILESDDELCLQVAAEMYKMARSRVNTDVEALAVVLSSWKECEDALAKARRTELEYHSRGRGGVDDSLREDIRKHEFTFKLLQRHKRGEVTNDEYWGALVCYGGDVGIYSFNDKHKKKWKGEFENAIAAGNEGLDRRFLIAPKRYPGIRLMTEEAYAMERARYDSFEDFTTRLPEPVAKAVNLARAYLKQ